MAELPLDPRLSRALLASCQAGCSQEVVTVVAMLSVQSVWFAGNGIRALDDAKAK
jgi:ATP-dependent RNA helicase DDX35